MSRNTPPMNVSGAFLLRPPFVLDSSKSFTVVAHRSFSELISRGQDPLTLIYVPVGLTKTAYTEDQLNNALVIALRDSAGNITYVPDTYIDQYPSMGSVPYSRLVGVIDLGMWPNERALDDVIATLKDACKANLGIEPEMQLARGSATNSVTEQMHVQLTTARTVAKTNNETPSATIIRLSDEISDLKVTIQEQTALIEALVASRPIP